MTEHLFVLILKERKRQVAVAMGKVTDADRHMNSFTMTQRQMGHLRVAVDGVFIIRA